MTGFAGRVGPPGALPKRAVVYSSADLGRNKRQGWRDLIGALYGPLDIDIADGDGDGFKGEIRCSSLGQSTLTEFVTDGEVAHREKRHIARDGEDFFLLGLSLSGVSAFEQYGRQACLPPRHLNLLHAASPYSFGHRECVRTLCLKIPGAALRARVADPHALCCKPMPVQPGLAQLAADMLVATARDADAMSDRSAAMLEAGMLDLLGLALGAGFERIAPGGTSVRRALHRRATGIIRQAMVRPDLDPDDVAAALGISTRYLHRVFEDAGQTVSATILDMRLTRTQEVLRDPAMRSLSIKEVAFRNGFRSQSHFASLFKARFQATPKQMRASEPVS